jgi:hypothetical protein
VVVPALAIGVAAAGEAQQEPRSYASWRHGPPSDPNYFPIAVWLQDPSQASRYKQAGINLYVGLWQGPTEAQLAALKRAGMPVICDLNAVARAHLDDPTIVGWMHGDEPDRGRAKLHYLNPVPINEIADRWIGKFERHRVQVLNDLKKALEEESNG